jgi:acetyl esterase
LPLDPQARTLLDALNARGEGGPGEPDPATVRAGYELLGAMGAPAADPPSTEDRTIPGPAGQIPVRIYRPQTAAAAPAVVFFHGGGFVIGSINSHDPLCQQLASRVPAVVVSVDYRLAPEHPFPAGLEDCWAAVQWVADNAAAVGADTSRLAVAGDSAGGNLAAVVARRARDAGAPALAFQLLIYPTTDATGSFPSIAENGQGYLLSADTMRWFLANYLGSDPGDKLRHPDVSPLYAPDLSGLAPAAVITAEFDPLRDEGQAYARALEEAGVPTRLLNYDGLIHAFMQLDGAIPAAGAGITDAVEALRQALVG